VPFPLPIVELLAPILIPFALGFFQALSVDFALYAVLIFVCGKNWFAFDIHQLFETNKTAWSTHR
jgi:predicted benzoate:H+ symporter BenE